jgi:hypothetical protein
VGGLGRNDAGPVNPGDENGRWLVRGHEKPDRTPLDHRHTVGASAATIDGKQDCAMTIATGLGTVYPFPRAGAALVRSASHM